MINFEEYYQYLLKRKKLSFHYNQRFEQLAQNSKYLRSNKITKRYQKDLEKERASSFNVLNNIFKEEQKKKGVVVKVKQEKDSKLKLFFRKIFNLKPPVISGIIEEFSETAGTPSEDPEKQEVDSEAILIDEETEDLEEDLEEDFEEDFDEYEFDDDFEDVEYYYSDDTLEGQMDIEELNEGDVYEKKQTKENT